VLVALAILAMAVTVILQLFSANLRSVAASEDYVAAASVAASKMREVLDDEKLDEFTSSDKTENGYEISVAVVETNKERTENLRVRILQVTVTASWQRGLLSRTLSLRTLKALAKKV
jgi:uncharacterized membrane protein